MTTKDETDTPPSRLWLHLTRVGVIGAGTVAVLGQLEAARDALFSFGLPFVQLWVWRSIGLVFATGVLAVFLFRRKAPGKVGLIITRVTLAALVLGSITAITHLRNSSLRWDGTLTVGIGFFEGEDGDPLQMRRAVYDEVAARLRSRENVQVIMLESPARKHETREEALRRIAAWRSVEVLIWGWYAVPGDTGTITVHYELAQRGLQMNHKRHRELLPKSDFEAFRVHGKLANQAEYVTLVTLGIAEFFRGNADQALSRLNEAITLPVAPDSVLPPAAVYGLRGQLNSLLFNLPAAERDYRKAIQLGLRDPGLYFALASTLAYHSPERALAVLDTAALLHPEFLSFKGYWTNRVGMFLQAGMMDSAVSGCRRLSAFPQSRADTMAFNVLINCGVVNEQTGRISEAIAAYRNARKLDPHHSFPHQNLGRALITLANSAWEAQQSDRAIEYYTESAQHLRHAAQIRPERPEIRLLRYEALRKLAHANAAARSEPLNTTLLGRALKEIEIYHNLIRDAPEGASFSAPSPIAYTYLVREYLYLDDVEGALKALNQRTELYGVDDEWEMLALYAEIASSAQRLGDYTTSELVLSQSIMHSPESTYGLYLRSLSRERSGDLTGAIRDIEIAVRTECGLGATRFLIASELAPPTLFDHTLRRNEAMLWRGLVGNYIAFQQGMLGCDYRRRVDR